MTIDWDMIRSASLFRGIDVDELAILLRCLHARTLRFEAEASIHRAGDLADTLGLVLSGSVRLERADYWGRRTALAEIGPGHIFSEIYACLEQKPLHVHSIAARPTRALFLDAKSVLTVCPSACAFHTRLVRNLLRVFAERTALLTSRLQHTAQRTTRDKALSYLSEQALVAGSACFDIPLNRQELADYLLVDRSALSNELSKMRDEGLLEFHKNHFTLLQRVALARAPQEKGRP